MKVTAIRSLVHHILRVSLLEHAADAVPRHDWSIQGFGMLRLHLPGDCRLNVWNSRYRVLDVSLMHTHPWNFESLVVNGTVNNRRYLQDEDGDLYNSARIKPGPGGGVLQIEHAQRLLARPFERITTGGSYSQLAHEIHSSHPEDGTVTLNARERVGEDVALVFWPATGKWVSAEPRRATREEVAAICGHALRVWE